ISLQKFQQKALKQTKQKKSKSSDFLMAELFSIEVSENPAFNINSTDISAHQTYKVGLIRYDKLTSSLAAHPQKLRLRAQAEPRGNECSRNYFDPLMDEEINPRQCGIEVSKEGEAELKGEDTLDSTCPVNSIKTSDLCDEVEDEDILPYIEQFEKEVHNEVILLDNFPCKQVRVNCTKKSQFTDIHLKCLRGIKDKVPQGSYSVKVSICKQLDGKIFACSKVDGQQMTGKSLPVRHNGNFYDVEISFGQSIYMDVPVRKNGKPGEILLFELFLLQGTSGRVVGWGVFPLCNNNLDIVDGKFKCPLLRGHYDSRIDRFQKIEKLISSDLDHWLCNLYFQVVSVVKRDTCFFKELEREFVIGKSLIFQSFLIHSKLCTSHHLSLYHFSCYSCHPAVDANMSSRLAKHFYFGAYDAFFELGRGQWYSWDFWSSVLLISFLWFIRLYLHYFSQWILLHFLQFLSQSKFQFYLYTVDLCYQNSLVHASEEMAMVVVGPLTLNTVMLLLILMRWCCQLLFDFFPFYLSKLIMAWGFWTVLDPLAVFVVDAFLGRLHYTADNPIADCAKLYWLFLRTEQTGIPGTLITLLLYAVLFLFSSATLHLYWLRLYNESWLLDLLQRIRGDETSFFVPCDLEISLQELSYLVKKAEQWRGIGGERRKVVVYEYFWEDHAKQPQISCSGIHPQDEILKFAGNSRGITIHVMIYTVHLGGFQELYRHFLRLPGGAIVEVSTSSFVSYNGILIEKKCLQRRADPKILRCLKKTTIGPPT
uniref:Uncharacterized protein n=1 Tax=Naja naja TaxID=35670 RepID=A0A8C6XRM6_NAJNA